MIFLISVYSFQHTLAGAYAYACTRSFCTHTSLKYAIANSTMSQAMLDAATSAITSIIYTMNAYRLSATVTTKRLTPFRRLELQFQSAIPAIDGLNSAC
jgi:tellurite resistance protein